MDSLQLLSKVKNIPLVSHKILEGLLSGNYRSVFRGPGLEFDEVRNYSETDDARFIDWNVTSRFGNPYIKTFREEREIILFLLIDVSASMNFGTADLKRSNLAALIAALLTQSAVINNDRVGAALFSERIESWIPPFKGRKHGNRLIKAILDVEPQKRGTGLEQAVRAVQVSLKKRSICVIISDFKTMSGWRELTLLAKKQDVIAIRLTDPADYQFPAKSLCYIQDPENHSIIPFFGFSDNYQKQYKHFWLDRELFWQRECRRRRIETLTISTTGDPAQDLLDFFSRRRKRA